MSSYRVVKAGSMDSGLQPRSNSSFSICILCRQGIPHIAPRKSVISQGGFTGYLGQVDDMNERAKAGPRLYDLDKIV